MSEKNDFVTRVKKLQSIHLIFFIILLILSLPLGFWVQKFFLNTNIPEVESGIKKYEAIKVNTKFETDLKETILKLSRGYEGTTWFMSIGVGVFVGAICFLSAIFNFFFWLNNRKFLSYIEKSEGT